MRRSFIIILNATGHGGTSKPSDGLHTKFLRCNHEDMVAAQHRLVTERLGVKQQRLVIGNSMGGMHTWLWGVNEPDWNGGNDTTQPKSARVASVFYGIATDCGKLAHQKPAATSALAGKVVDGRLDAPCAAIADERPRHHRAREVLRRRAAPVVADCAASLTTRQTASNCPPP
jgi:homoserine O-acetyltransferase